MKLKSFLFIFLMIVTLLTLGCGDNGNDLFSSTHSSPALAKISGQLAGASNEAVVTFYSPEAAVRKSLDTNPASVRANSNSEGIYTFGVNKGYFNAAVPEGEYFIVAVDGNKRAVTDKKFFSARASFITVPTITLKKTYKLSGVVSSNLVSTAHIPVYIENMPFMTITDAGGNFSFNALPQLDTSSYYKICVYVNKDGSEYFTSKSINNTELQSETLHSLTLSQSTISQSFKRIAGHVYRGNTNMGVPDKRVYLFLVGSVKFYAAITDSSGAFAFDISTDETSARLTLNMVDFIDASFGSTNVKFFEDLYPVTYNLRIDTALSGLSGAETKLTVYAHSDNSQTLYLSEDIVPGSSHPVGGLPPGFYSYYTKSDKLTAYTYWVKEKFEITDADVSNRPEHKFVHEIPVIEVENSGYFAKHLPDSSTPWTGANLVLRAYALNQDNSPIPLELSSATGEIDLSLITSPGEYRIYVETAFSYGHIKETLTSPPCPYVKY